MNTLLFFVSNLQFDDLIPRFFNLFFRVLPWIPWPLMFLILYMCHPEPESALHAVKMLLLSDST